MSEEKMGSSVRDLFKEKGTFETAARHDQLADNQLLLVERTRYVVLHEQIHSKWQVALFGICARANSHHLPINGDSLFKIGRQNRPAILTVLAVLSAQSLVTAYVEGLPFEKRLGLDPLLQGGVGGQERRVDFSSLQQQVQKR